MHIIGIGYPFLWYFSLSIITERRILYETSVRAQYQYIKLLKNKYLINGIRSNALCRPETLLPRVQSMNKVSLHVTSKHPVKCKIRV